MNATNTHDTLRVLRQLISETQNYYLVEKGWKLARHQNGKLYWKKIVNGHEYEMETTEAVENEESRA
jgi:hypothetical protein